MLRCTARPPRAQSRGSGAAAHYGGRGGGGEGSDFLSGLEFARYKAALLPRWDGAFEEELYSHAGDAGTSLEAWENANQAAANPAVAAQLRAQLRAFFTKH